LTRVGRIRADCCRSVLAAPRTLLLASFNLENVAWAADAPIEDRVQALIPDVEAYIASGMKGFDVPSLAIGIVAGDRLVYAKGFRRAQQELWTVGR
jgi:CubicO group peptidase (beta-lactamase class C family)